MNRKVYSFLGLILLLMGIFLTACTRSNHPNSGEVKPPPDFVPVTYEAKDCSYGGLFKSMQAVDAYTVQFILCSPEPAFLSKIASAAFAIYPKEFLEKYAGTSTLLEKPIGTGSYLVTEWKRGEELDLKRFDGYWGDKAKTSTLIFRWSADSSQRLSELQAGSVDGIDNVEANDFNKVKSDANLQLITRPGLNIFYIGLNNAYKPFDNEQVRQAIAMGINREQIVRTSFPSGSEVASHFTPCGIPNGCAGENWYAFDPERARQLLAQAGFPNGFDTVIRYRDVVRSYLPQPGVVAQVLQTQLSANLNINARIEVVDKSAFLDLTSTGQLQDIYLLGWSVNYPDITDFLDYHFGIGSSNQFGKKWDDITTALLYGSSLSEDASRQPYYETANHAIKQHVPMIPIAHVGSAVAFKKSVHEAYASPLGQEYFAGMTNNKDSLVFMQAGEPGSLYCNDEIDRESFRPCSQIMESLMRYGSGGVAVEPSLATGCTPNISLTEWTCSLRKGVKFQDGSTFDAGDVIATLHAEWDASSPQHKGSMGIFEYWNSLWGGFLNSPTR